MTGTPWSWYKKMVLTLTINHLQASSWSVLRPESGPNSSNFADAKPRAVSSVAGNHRFFWSLRSLTSLSSQESNRGQQVLVVTTGLQFRWSIPLAYFGLKRRPSFSWERKTQQVSGDVRRNKSNISKKTKWLAPNQPFFSEPGAPLDWDHSQVISAVSSANSTWDGNLWKSFDKATANLRYLATMLVFSSILYFFI